MICTLTARRLVAGAYDAFRAAWDPTAVPDALRGWTHVYHARDVTDPDVVVSFGFFDGSLDELRAAQALLGRESQVGRVQPLVAEVLLDGAYAVIEEFEP